MSALSELLNRERPADMSLREIARRAQDRGHTLAPGTVSKYFSGQHGIPDEDTLRAFHEVLNIPLRELRAAADLPVGVPGPYVPPKEADRLDLDQRQAVDQIIRLLARKAVVGDERDAAPTMTTTTPSAPDEAPPAPESGVADEYVAGTVPPSAEGSGSMRGPRVVERPLPKKRQRKGKPHAPGRPRGTSEG